MREDEADSERNRTLEKGNSSAPISASKRAISAEASATSAAT